jgi:hypothetical protein
MKALSRLAVIALSAGAAMVSILVSIVASIGTAWAGLGQPSPWEMDLQDSASPVMQDVAGFHFFLLWVIAAISAFVLALLLIVILRFNARANPAPTRTTHNTPIEILWTIVCHSRSRRTTRLRGEQANVRLLDFVSVPAVRHVAGRPDGRRSAARAVNSSRGRRMTARWTIE